jgi:hypothetical protein
MDWFTCVLIGTMTPVILILIIMTAIGGRKIISKKLPRFKTGEALFI